MHASLPHNLFSRCSMPISIVCSHCEKKLKVDDAAAGKKIRCPACKETIAVAEADAEATPPPKNRKAAAPDEQEDDDGYVMDERRDEEDEQLRRDRRRDQKRRDRQERERRRRACKPHRGVLLLTLGILSIVLSCASIISWILAWRTIQMANEDLYAMSAGRMDRAGEGMTKAASICGYLGAVLAIVLLILAITLKVISA